VYGALRGALQQRSVLFQLASQAAASQYISIVNDRASQYISTVTDRATQYISTVTDRASQYISTVTDQFPEAL
jgi:hypothetical protein